MLIRRLNYYVVKGSDGGPTAFLTPLATRPVTFRSLATAVPVEPVATDLNYRITIAGCCVNGHCNIKSTYYSHNNILEYN